MNTISETELTDYLQNHAVKKIHVVLQKNGKYHIYIKLTWKDGDLTLVNIRKKPREWASLDRLARHIRDKYNGTLPLISLDLNDQTQPSE